MVYSFERAKAASGMPEGDLLAWIRVRRAVGTKGGGYTR